MQQRKSVDKFQEDVGHFNTHFTNLALTGFLSPWVPGLLGFRMFGKGIGGICRTAAVSTVTAIYTASVSFPWPQIQRLTGILVDHGSIFKEMEFTIDYNFKTRI